jgi:hypothetical protein
MRPTVAFVRSIEVGQAAPFLAECVELLRAESVDARLYYTDGVCTPADFPAPSRRLDPKATAEEIYRALVEDSVGHAASLSIPDENAVRDGFVKAHFESRGGRLITSPADTSRTFANKWETKAALKEHGFTAPAAVFADGDLLNGRGPDYVEYHSVLRDQVRRIGYPVLAKPLWDCLGNGVVYLPDEQALSEYLAAPPSGNVLVEQCVSGTLCSVEVICEGGRYFIQPIVWKGEAGGPPSFPFTQVRHTAVGHGLSGYRELHDSIASFASAPGTEGAFEFEFVYDGEFHCIEVNPRVSGSTGISIAASGVNTYYELARMALGQWRPPEADREPSVALQFPVLVSTTPPALRDRATVHRWNTFTVEGSRYRNALVSVGSGQWPAFEAWITSTAVESGVITPSTAGSIAAVSPVAQSVPY